MQALIYRNLETADTVILTTTSIENSSDIPIMLYRGINGFREMGPHDVLPGDLLAGDFLARWWFNAPLPEFAEWGPITDEAIDLASQFLGFDLRTLPPRGEGGSLE